MHQVLDDNTYDVYGGPERTVKKDHLPESVSVRAFWKSDLRPAVDITVRDGDNRIFLLLTLHEARAVQGILDAAITELENFETTKSCDPRVWADFLRASHTITVQDDAGVKLLPF